MSTTPEISKEHLINVLNIIKGSELTYKELWNHIAPYTKGRFNPDEKDKNIKWVEIQIKDAGFKSEYKTEADLFRVYT